MHLRLGSSSVHVTSSLLNSYSSSLLFSVLVYPLPVPLTKSLKHAPVIICWNWIEWMSVCKCVWPCEWLPYWDLEPSLSPAGSQQSPRGSWAAPGFSGGKENQGALRRQQVRNPTVLKNPASHCKAQFGHTTVKSFLSIHSKSMQPKY